jgi:hypothetical protein
MASDVNYDEPCVNCERTDCDGERCMDLDPEDEFLRDLWREEYQAWAESRKARQGAGT